MKFLSAQDMHDEPIRLGHIDSHELDALAAFDLKNFLGSRQNSESKAR